MYHYRCDDAGGCTTEGGRRHGEKEEVEEGGVASFPTDIHHSWCPATVTYRSRASEVKTAVHWGQRKLLMSEMQLLSDRFASALRAVRPLQVVYVGSAPGSHLALLDDLFGRRHRWHLVDPGWFDRDTILREPADTVNQTTTTAESSRASRFIFDNSFMNNEKAYHLFGQRMEYAGCPALASVVSGRVADDNATRRRDGHTSVPDASNNASRATGGIDAARLTFSIPTMFEHPVDAWSRFPGLHVLSLAVVLGASPPPGTGNPQRPGPGDRHGGGAPTLLISDVRSGHVGMPNFEGHVIENMRAQQAWIDVLQPTFSMVKFRLPYHKHDPQTAGAPPSCVSDAPRVDECEYLDGAILAPIWALPTSTESRLVSRPPFARKSHDCKNYQNQMYFFNAVAREVLHFNHISLPSLRTATVTVPTATTGDAEGVVGGRPNVLSAAQLQSAFQVMVQAAAKLFRSRTSSVHEKDQGGARPVSTSARSSSNWWSQLSLSQATAAGGAHYDEAAEVHVLADYLRTLLQVAAQDPSLTTVADLKCGPEWCCATFWPFVIGPVAVAWANNPRSGASRSTASLLADAAGDRGFVASCVTLLSAYISLRLEDDFDSIIRKRDGTIRKLNVLGDGGADSTGVEGERKRSRTTEVSSTCTPSDVHKLLVEAGKERRRPLWIRRFDSQTSSGLDAPAGSVRMPQ